MNGSPFFAVDSEITIETKRVAISKREAIHTIRTLIKSCQEGIDGTWDAGSPDRDEGFSAMIWQLEGLLNYVEENNG